MTGFLRWRKFDVIYFMSENRFVLGSASAFLNGFYSLYNLPQLRKRLPKTFWVCRIFCVFRIGFWAFKNSSGLMKKTSEAFFDASDAELCGSLYYTAKRRRFQWFFWRRRGGRMKNARRGRSLPAFAVTLTDARARRGGIFSEYCSDKRPILWYTVIYISMNFNRRGCYVF